MVNTQLVLTMIKMGNFTCFFIFSHLSKENFMDLSWILQLICVSVLSFISIFKCEMVHFDPKLPFQGFNPTKIGPWWIIVNLTHFLGFLTPKKTRFVHLSWVLQLECGSFLAIISIFKCGKVDFSPKSPFHAGTPS